MEYISTSETAKKWGISVQRVRVLCHEERIPGIIKVGKSYMVPFNADILLSDLKHQSYVRHKAIMTGINEPGSSNIQKILCTFRKIAG